MQPISVKCPFWSNATVTQFGEKAVEVEFLKPARTRGRVRERPAPSVAHSLISQDSIERTLPGQHYK